MYLCVCVIYTKIIPKFQKSIPKMRSSTTKSPRPHGTQAYRRCNKSNRSRVFKGSWLISQFLCSSPSLDDHSCLRFWLDRRLPVSLQESDKWMLCVSQSDGLCWDPWQGPQGRTRLSVWHTPEDRICLRLFRMVPIDFSFHFPAPAHFLCLSPFCIFLEGE